MMAKPRVLLPLMSGTNCHRETARAFELAGADPRVIPVGSLRRGKVKLYETDLIALSGGFSYGDHFGSGRVAAIELKTALADQLQEAMARRIPILGICNGYQILMQTGLLPGGRLDATTAALDFNANGRFEHRHGVKVVLHEPATGCVWTTGLNGMEMTIPVGHGEGRQEFQKREEEIVTATYGTYEGNAEYPVSPNGSPIAGTCDPSGRIMGMMPHPERRADKTYGSDAGLAIFKAGVDAVR